MARVMKVIDPSLYDRLMHLAKSEEDTAQKPEQHLEVEEKNLNNESHNIPLDIEDKDSISFADDIDKKKQKNTRKPRKNPKPRKRTIKPKSIKRKRTSKKQSFKKRK